MRRFDYAGCLHVHTTHSDGDETVAELVAAACDVGLHFLVLADHAGTDDPHRQSHDGWHGGVLLIDGTEVGAGHHHCLALGLPDRTGAAHGATEAQLASIKARGGLAFVAHPKPCHHPAFGVWTPGWSDWHLDTFDGLEIWPYMHDWIRDLRPWNFLSHCWDPDRWVTGPEPEILARWDEVGRRRRCVGLGALDHHGRRVPFRRRGPALFEILPSRYTFRTVRTHVLAPERLAGQPADADAVCALLAAGRCYVSYDLHADATGFGFWADRGDQLIEMGDEAPVGEPVEFRALCPRSATIRLLRDGQTVAATTGRRIHSREQAPGVYRLEAALDGRPWIFSNPICLRDSGGAPGERVLA